MTPLHHPQSLAQEGQRVEVGLLDFRQLIDLPFFYGDAHDFLNHESLMWLDRDVRVLPVVLVVYWKTVLVALT